MLYVFPDYYPEFQCIAGECEDTCCAGWQIVVDEASLKKYRAHKGPYRKTLHRSINWKEQIFRQDREKRCAFLNEENLCEMYCHLGPKSLCRTCRLYPRHIEEFENVREISLSVSCPEAARLLLYRKEPLKFREFWREKEETYEEFDELFYSQLTECRSLMIRILQDRRLPLKIRVGLVSGLANDMQKRFNEGRLFECQELFERVEKAVTECREEVSGDGNGDYCVGGETCADVFSGKQEILKKTAQKMSSASHCQYSWAKDMLTELHNFECLKEEWPLWLTEVQDWLYANGQSAYEQLEQEFLDWLEGYAQDWQIPFEHLMVYFLFTYFCGAVYDGEILASAQLGIVHCWMLREMLMATWLRNGKEITMEDLRELVIRYSRELEHSDINQKQMEKLMTRKRLPWLKGKQV